MNQCANCGKETLHWVCQECAGPYEAYLAGDGLDDAATVAARWQERGDITARRGAFKIVGRPMPVRRR